MKLKAALAASLLVIAPSASFAHNCPSWKVMMNGRCVVPQDVDKYGLPKDKDVSNFNPDQMSEVADMTATVMSGIAGTNGTNGTNGTSGTNGTNGTN